MNSSNNDDPERTRADSGESRRFGSARRRTMLSAIGSALFVSTTATQTSAVDHTEVAADFTVRSPTRSNEPIVFDVSVPASVPTVQRFEWSIETEDGVQYATSRSSVQTHTWTETGEYDVVLEIIGAEGTVDSTRKTLAIEDNEPPIVNFTIDPSPAEVGETVILNGSVSSDPDGNIDSFNWAVETEYGSEEVVGSDSSQTVAYSWDQKGSYDVSLLVTDNDGETDIETKSVKVGNEPPTAEFDLSPSEPDLGEEVTLDASASQDPDGNIADYRWSIDSPDGSSSSPTGQQTTFNPTTDGDYDITLTVEDSGGEQDSTTTSVFIGNRSPEPTFRTSPSSVETGTPVTLDATSADDPDGSITTYRWTIETEDSLIAKSGVEASHLWNAVGRYEVTLTVTDDDGESASRTTDVDVQNRPPTAVIDTVTAGPLQGEPVTFDGVNSTDPDNAIQSYSWTIESEPGTPTYNGGRIDHTFEDSGPHTVVLTVEDEEGATDTTREQIDVSDPETRTATETTATTTDTGGSSETETPDAETDTPREPGPPTSNGETPTGGTATTESTETTSAAPPEPTQESTVPTRSTSSGARSLTPRPTETAPTRPESSDTAAGTDEPSTGGSDGGLLQGLLIAAGGGTIAGLAALYRWWSRSSNTEDSS